MVRPMRPVPLGLAHTLGFDPTAEDTAAAVGNAGVEAVATVTLILWIEATCAPLLHPYLEEGEAGVGVRVAVDHTGPAFAGRPVDVHAEATAVSGRKVVFSVRLEQDGREVMTGEHTRAVVDLERFLDGRAAPRVRPERPPVAFYFDVHSPWSYLAATRIGALCRRYGAELLWRPVHLANLIETIGGLRPMEQTPARVAWYERDVRDRFRENGLVHDPRPDYPLRPSRALRCFVYAAERGCAEAFVLAVMRGYWSERADITDPAWLQRMADAAGLGPRPMAGIAADEGYKAAVARNTAEAIERSVFGVPTFLFEGKLHFGSDRLDMLERALAAAPAGG